MQVTCTLRGMSSLGLVLIPMLKCLPDFMTGNCWLHPPGSHQSVQSDVNTVGRDVLRLANWVGLKPHPQIQRPMILALNTVFSCQALVVKILSCFSRLFSRSPYGSKVHYILLFRFLLSTLNSPSPCTLRCTHIAHTPGERFGQIKCFLCPFLPQYQDNIKLEKKK